MANRIKTLVIDGNTYELNAFDADTSTTASQLNDGSGNVKITLSDAAGTKVGSILYKDGNVWKSVTLTTPVSGSIEHAESATKATLDGNGNNIKDSYAASLGMNGNNLRLRSMGGTTLSEFVCGYATNCAVAVQASNANLSKTENTSTGDTLRIGSGTSQTIGNAGNAKKWDGWYVNVGSLTTNANTICII